MILPSTLLLVLSTLTAPAAPAAAELPVLFEQNLGSFDPAVHFSSRAAGYTLFLTEGAAVFALDGPEGRTTSVRARFVDALAGIPVGIEPAETRVHRYRGADPSAWITDIPTFRRVGLLGVWEGIDLQLYDRRGAIEYEFVVAPGADPSRVRIAYEGADDVTIGDDGGLVIATPFGELHHSPPVLYQEGSDGPRPVSGRFVVTGPHEIGFAVDRHDTDARLVIDPVLVYAAQLGGSKHDYVRDVAVGAAGAAVLVGRTNSADLPVTPGAIDSTVADYSAFVAQLSPDGDSLAWCTYLGGSAPVYQNVTDDRANAVCVDGAGRVYVAGLTSTSDFPVTAGAIKSTQPSWTDAFVTQLASDGTLLFSTYLGGVNRDEAYGIDVDDAGTVYVCGETGGFPVTPGAVQTTKGSQQDAFVCWFQPGGPLQYATYLGDDGSGGWQYGYAIRVGADDRVYVAGRTDGPSFPVTPSAFQPGKSIGYDGFVVRLSPAGALEYGSFLGGLGSDFSVTRTDLATDGAGKVWVVGSAYDGYPVTPGAFQSSTLNAGFATGVMTCFDTTQSGASSVVFSTYIGGFASDALSAVEVDGDGNAWALGYTSNAGFPTLDAWDDEKHANSSDAVLVGFDPAGSLLTSSFYGGTGNEPSTFAPHLQGGLAIDDHGDLYLAYTFTGDTIVTPGAHASGPFSLSQANSYVAKFTTAAVVCQAGIGFAGPGDLTLSICGGDLSPDTWSRLRVTGAKAGSTILLFASAQSNPTWVSELGATLVPVPIALAIAVPLGASDELDLLVPGTVGPATLYMQAVAPNQGSTVPIETSNALQVVVP